MRIMFRAVLLNSGSLGILRSQHMTFPADVTLGPFFAERILQLEHRTFADSLNSFLGFVCTHIGSAQTTKLNCKVPHLVPWLLC